jgi:DNA-binding transcriptional LysR family regulator
VLEVIAITQDDLYPWTTFQTSSETGIGELHVGYAPSPTTQILPRALEVFREKNPKIQLHLHDISTAEMLLLLREKKLHVALTVLPSRKHLRGLDYIQVASYPLCLALASKHPVSKLKTIKPEQFVEEPFIGYSRKSISGIRGMG